MALKGVAALAVVAAGLLSGTAAAQTALRPELVMNGLYRPVDVQSTPAFPEYIYIVQLIDEDEPVGRIFWKNIVTGESGLFFETPEEVWRGIERGLQSMVWDPNAVENGFFYVNYNDATGTNVVARFHATSATSGDSASRHVILTIGQTLTNHQSHWLGFGPSDGLLYIAVGDGGGSNDPDNRAQTIDGEWHGKLLRVDPSSDGFAFDVLRNYRVPPGNPFTSGPGDDEIWAYGLRNPWRNAFDPQTGELYIADVGQGAWEEINFEAAGHTGGTNYGWRCWEGTHRSEVEECDSPQGAQPVLEYPHEGGTLSGCSISGGVVYRGPDPDLNGRYFFGDLCKGRVWSIRMVAGVATDFREHAPLTGVANIVSFGVDQLGGLYVIDFEDGEVYRLVPTEGVENDCNANGWDDGIEVAMNTDLDKDGGPTGNPVDGSELFAGDCASCHGTTGQGGSGPNIRNDTRARLHEVLTGESEHAGGTHDEYSAQQLANLEAYLSNQGTRARPDGVPDSCQDLADCDRDGATDGAEFLAGTQRDLDFDGDPDECIGTQLSPSAAINGNIHTTFVTDDGIVIVLSYDAATDRWFSTEYDNLGQPESLRSESFVDRDTQVAYIAVAARDGLHLVAPEVDGDVPRSLTLEIPSATPIVGATTTFTSLDGITFIAGMNGAGELVMYWQTGQADAQGRKIWSYTNLYADLQSQSLPTPAFTGELVSYVTPWNGLNIAGLDEDGVIWSVWWAPGLELWSSSNLSEITGAAPIVGKLTAYVTSWGGLNLAGLDADGNVIVTWWVPEFGGDWAQNNLSQQFGHPGLKVGELTSYVTPWGGLNIAGLDESGQLVIYWWSPGLEDWIVSPLSALIPGAPLPASSVRGLAAPTGMLSVFAFTSQAAGEDVIRYFWQPDGEWQVQNVSDIAVPR